MAEKQIDTFRNGLMSGTVWKETIYDERPLDSYSIELRNGRDETFVLHLNQIPELVAVLQQAVRCVQEHGPETFKFDWNELLTASRDAESSR